MKSRKLTLSQLLALVLFLLFILTYCLKLSFHISDVKYVQLADLRNRIVGARLIDQGISPYYFKWNPSYPITLYDQAEICNIRNNIITGPPSLLFLMQPLAKLDFDSICYVWVTIQYVFFLLTIVPILLLYKSPSSRAFIFLAGILLLLTDQWDNLFFMGQSHFIFPAIIANIFLLLSGDFRNRYLFTGLLMALLVWIRPNALLIVPFLFLCKGINGRQLLGGLIAGGFILGTVTLVFGHLSYWIDFYSSCKEWMKNNVSDLDYERCVWPGVMDEKKTISPPVKMNWRSENANILTLVRTIFHVNLRQSLLFGLFVIPYIIILYMAFRKRAKHFSEAILLGVLLYWFGEMTTPLLKSSYYYVELFVVVLFLAGKFRKLHLAEQVLLCASFLFSFLDPLRMNLFIGELCTVACLAVYLIRQRLVESTASAVT